MCAGLEECTDGIGEVGFDTRTLWSDGSRHGRLPCRFTVLQGEKRYEEREPDSWDYQLTGMPDLMSYCEAKLWDPEREICHRARPARWVSTYRWEALFEHAFPTITASGLAGAATPQGPQSIAFVEGQVNDDGTGSLDPVFVQPGQPSAGVEPGDYAIQVLDAADATLLTLPFDVSFLYTEIEGQPPLELDNVPFAFRLPEQPGAAKILLTKGTQTLDTIQVSDHAPSVTVLEPNGGENWNSTHTIRWQASDQDGDPLTFIILYSPDDGNSWLPVAWGIQGRSYNVDIESLPGSDKGRVRLIATDGYRTTLDDSDGPFSVGGKPPAANIINPEHQTRFQPGDVVRLAGTAFDVDDGLLSGESLVWSHEDTVMGIGGEMRAHFPTGIHRVTLTAVDSDGQTGADTILVYVGYQAYLPITFRND
jgi:hypothetical protein